jgi:ABC-type lipoprotein export system ATPase subunit
MIACRPPDRAAREPAGSLPVRPLSGGQRQAVAIGPAIYWQA